MRSVTIVLGAVLLLGGCGRAAHQPAETKASATVDPEILSLRAQLAQARSERDAALARLHAIQHRKPAVTRIVVREPAAAAPHENATSQPASRVFSTITTATSP